MLLAELRARYGSGGGASPSPGAVRSPMRSASSPTRLHALPVSTLGIIRKALVVVGDVPSPSSVYALCRLAHVHKQQRSYHPTGPQNRDNECGCGSVLLLY